MTQYPNTVKIASNNNEHARHAVSMGVDVGSPDLLLYTRKYDVTYFLFLELKKKKGKLSESQKEWNEIFDKSYKSKNCIRDVAYGFEQARNIISTWLGAI